MSFLSLKQRAAAYTAVHVWHLDMGLRLLWFASCIQLSKTRFGSWGNPQKSRKLRGFPEVGSSPTMTFALWTGFAEFLSIRHPVTFKFSTAGEDPVIGLSDDHSRTQYFHVVGLKSLLPQVFKFLLPVIKNMLQQREEGNRNKRYFYCKYWSYKNCKHN